MPAKNIPVDVWNFICLHSHSDTRFVIIRASGFFVDDYGINVWNRRGGLQLTLSFSLFRVPGLVTMSGQGSGGNSSGGSSLQMQASSLPGGYQPMDCESSPRHSGSRRAITTGYPSASSSSTGVPASSASMSMQSMDSSLIQSSLGSYNSLILPGLPHLPAMMTSPMIQQQNFYNYGYSKTDTHGMVRQPSTVSTGNQRDPEREDSPMVGVCVQQSPVAIHWDGEEQPDEWTVQLVAIAGPCEQQLADCGCGALGIPWTLRCGVDDKKAKGEQEKWQGNILKSYPDAAFSAQSQTTLQWSRSTDAPRQLWQWIQQIFRTRWFGQIILKVHKKFSRKIQKIKYQKYPTLCVNLCERSQKQRSTLKLGGVNDCAKSPTS